MGRIEKTVFISYRRTNAPWALAIYYDLTQHGYDVFYDYKGIASGDFESVILENIRARAHFLILLTPSALQRCDEPGDWLRREIETALDSQRNIIPLTLEGFDFSTPAIVDQLRYELGALKRYNALNVPADYFSEAMDRLRERYLNVPLDAVLHPASGFALQAARDQQAALGVAPTVHGRELAAHWYEQGVAEEAIVIDPDYSNRPGYDPSFLETVDVPLPRVSKAMEQDTARVKSDAQRHDDPFELTYYHYSVYMNKRRRTAWFSAANVDGDHRPYIGQRRGDRWYTDPRILRSEQIGQEAFEPGIDFRHLTRREDTAWGNDVASATLANNDTFHFTNCSLQASPFNQGKDRWQELEQFLLEQRANEERRRLVVITGPLFATNDPVYKNDRMNYSLRYQQFWKICVLIRRDGTPLATAFVLGQEEILDLPGFEEAFDVVAAQVRVADLEERTGLDFGNIKKFDAFAAGGGTLEPGVRRSKIVRTGSDIVV